MRRDESEKYNFNDRRNIHLRLIIFDKKRLCCVLEIIYFSPLHVPHLNMSSEYIYIFLQIFLEYESKCSSDIWAALSLSNYKSQLANAHQIESRRITRDNLQDVIFQLTSPCLA